MRQPIPRSIALLLASVAFAACQNGSPESTEEGDASRTRDVADTGPAEDTIRRDLDADADRSDSQPPPDGGSETGGREITLPSLEPVEANGFSTSKDCATCHSNAEGVEAMRDSAGRAVGFYDLWQASMMANATRDPFWRAAVSAEIEKSPGAAEAIQDKCLRCHAPMASETTRRRGDDRLALEALHGDSDLSQLAIDGVSCTACHQIKPDDLGTPASFTGGFETTTEKTAFGPYADVFAEPMEDRNGFAPKKGDHMRDSGLCGSCHTLYTDPVDRMGNSTTSERFPEQTPFLEWKNSRYGDGTSDDRSCQSCHEPTEDREGRPIRTQIARTKYRSTYSTEKVPKRSPYGRHLFVGGNTLIPAILRDHRETLRPAASDDAFDALLERTRRQLEERTAAVDVDGTKRTTRRLTFDVEIEVRTGHKFPTGYPARRAWLETKVTDAAGDVLFHSGAFDPTGRILDGDGEPRRSESAGGPIEPHHDLIDSESEVQIYESVMENAQGEPTWRLMRAADYAKDNRLLPKGWSSNHPSIDEMAPVGVGDDSNFNGGGDRVTYRVPLPSDAGTLNVQTTLHYQPLAHRSAMELFQVDTPAVRDFEFYWSHADRRPETIDTAETTVAE